MALGCACLSAIAAGRNTEFGAKTALEIRQVLDPDIQCNFRNRRATADEQARRVAQTRPQYPLMGRDAGNALEGTEEMVAAEASGAGKLSQSEWLRGSRF